MARKSVGGLSIDLELNTAKLVKGVDAVNYKLAKFSKVISRSFQLMGTAIGGYGLYKSLDAFVGKVSKLADVGEEAGNIALGFKKLGGSGAEIDKAKASILGVVDSFTLMKLANQGLVKGIAGFGDHFGQIAELGGRLAETLGIDTVSAIEKVTKALASGKEKQLESVGIIINQDTATRKFAEANELMASKLSMAQKREAGQIAGMEALGDAIERVAALTDSASMAHKAYQMASAEVSKEIGIEINENQELTQAWRDMETAIKGIDTKQVAQDIASISAAFLNLGATVLPIAVRELNLVALGLKAVRNWGDAGLTASQIKSDAELAATTKAANAIKTLRGITIQQGDQAVVPDIAQYNIAKKAVTELQEAVATGNVKIATASDILAESQRQLHNTAVILGVDQKEGAKHTEKSAKELAAEEKAAAKAAAELEKLSNKWRTLNQTADENTLKQSIDDAISVGDQASFDTLIAKFRDVTATGVREGLLQEFGGTLPAGAEEYIQQMTENTVKPYTDKMAEGLLEAHKKAVEGWSKFFEDAITGEKFDLTNMFKQIAVGFAAELTASLTKGMTGLDFSSPQNLGSGLAQTILQGAMSGQGGSFSFEGLMGSLFGQSGNASGAGSGDIAGPLLENGNFSNGLLSTEAGGLFQGAGGGAAYLTAAVSAMDDLMQIGKNSKKTAVGIGSGLGAGIGAAFGGPIGAQIGQAIGKQAGYAVAHVFGLGGPQNKDTLARFAFGKQFNEQAKAVGGIRYFDASGKQRGLDELQMGSNKQFNGAWVEEMDAWGGKAKTTFLALGKALAEVYGITEDVGGEMGKILGDNLGGSIDAARMMVQQLGVSFEDLEAAMLSSAMKGEMRWSEFNVSIGGLNEAFKEGLEAVGAYDEAFKQLEASGGRGMAAVVSLKNIAIEAMEAGVKDFETLKQLLISKGFSQEEVDALINSIQGRGIKTLEELKGASNQTLGAIIGDMEAASGKLSESWQKMGADIDELNKKIGEIPDKVEKSIDVSLNLPEKWDEFIAATQPGGGSSTPPTGVTPSAKGNVFTAPTLSLMGEAGPEAILPLRRINGRLGVSMVGAGNVGQTVVNIDARGAAPGVEARIMDALRSVRDQAISGAISAIQDGRSRGRMGGDW
ncbi:hypothetical protein CCP3SC15_610015 [Gammaproteobacteria bacterium]